MSIALPMALGTSLLSYWIGQKNKKEASETLQPIRDRFNMQPMASDIAPEGRGTPNTSAMSFSPEVQRYLREAGIGGGMFPSRPGQQDLASVLMQGASNRFDAEKQLQSELESATSQYQNQWMGAQNVLEGGIAEASADKAAGLQDFDQALQMGLGQINSAQQQSRDNVRQAFETVQTQLSGLTDTINQSISTVMGLRDEALQSHADHTVALIDSTTAGYQHKLGMAKSEIMSRTDIPQAARESMAMRAEFLSGTEMRNHSAQIMADQSRIGTELRISQDAMVSSALNNATSVLGQFRTAGIGVLGQSLITDSNVQSQLAEAASNLGQSWAEASGQFRHNMTVAESNMRMTLAGLKTAGAMDMYNMIASTPHAYLDLSTEFGELMSIGINIQDHDLQRIMNEYNMAASQLGLEYQMFAPMQNFSMGVLSNTVQSEYQLQAAQIQANAAENAAIWSGVSQGAGTAWGGYLGRPR